MQNKTFTEILHLLQENNLLQKANNLEELKNNLKHHSLNKYIYGFKNIERFLNYDYQINGFGFELFGRNYTAFKTLKQKYNQLFKTQTSIYTHYPDQKCFKPTETSVIKRLRYNQYYHLHFKIDYHKNCFIDEFKTNLLKLAKNHNTTFIMIAKHQDLYAEFFMEISDDGIKNNYASFNLYNSNDIIKDLLFSIAVLVYSYQNLNNLIKENINFKLSDQQYQEIINANTINYHQI